MREPAPNSILICMTTLWILKILEGATRDERMLFLMRAM